MCGVVSTVVTCEFTVNEHEYVNRKSYHFICQEVESTADRLRYATCQFEFWGVWLGWLAYKTRQGDAHIVQNIIRYWYVPDIICGEFDDDLHSLSLTPRRCSYCLLAWLWDGANQTCNTVDLAKYRCKVQSVWKPFATLECSQTWPVQRRQLTTPQTGNYPSWSSMNFWAILLATTINSRRTGSWLQSDSSKMLTPSTMPKSWYGNQLPKMDNRRDGPTKKVYMTECEDIMRAIWDIDAKFGSGCRPVRFVAHDIRNLPNLGELDNSSIFDRVCKLERQMASMLHAPTFAAPTRTQSLVTDEATDAATTKRTEWQRQQRDLRVALPPPSTSRGGCEDGEDSDEGFSLPTRQQRRVKQKEWQTERRNEAQRPQQQHVQQATRETGARPRTKVVRVDKKHTADDIKVFIQEQEVTVIDISCVSHVTQILIML